MKALSLKQPWAWAVLHAGKNIENRRWQSDYRGPFWVAASAQVTRGYFDEAKAIIERLAPGAHVPPLDELPRGCIIGRARLVDVIHPGGASGHHPWRPGSHKLHPARWHFLDQYGFVIEEERALDKPVECKGLQRWWTVPPAVRALLERA
jgi:hypothetical protein